MKIQIVFVLMLALYGCASLQNPEETNIAVSALLDEIQIAINEIDAKTSSGSSLPPFKKAVVKLSTQASITSGGSATLILSGERSSTTTDSNILILELVPNPNLVLPSAEGTGHNIANYIIAAVSAIDENRFLKLESLTIQTGLEVLQKSGGGIEVELIGITIEGGRSSKATNSHSMTLIFAEQPKPNNTK